MRTDNRLHSEAPDFGTRDPSRRRLGMTGSSLVSARTDSRLRSESSSHGRRLKRRTLGAWTMS